MKKILIALTSVAIITSAFAFTNVIKKGEPTNYTVDAKQSKVDFSGSKTEGYHPGYFPVKSGSVAVTDGKITGGSFIIDVAGVKVTDGAGAMLEGHLKKADFFDAEKFSEASFTIKSVSYAKDNATAKITGSLSLKGISADVTFNAIIRGVSDSKLFAEAYFDLDRTLFGMSYGVGKISKDVQIGVHLFAAK